MANKVRYGLKNTKYAVYNADGGTFGSVVEFPGAVSLSLTREGGDSSDFYADDGVYFTFAGTNGGYSADLEVAKVPDSVRVALLGEVVDETSGIQYELTGVQAPQFALITEVQGDQYPTGFCFYNCKASRVEMSANTLNDSPSVDTETLSLRIAAHEVTLGGEKKGVVQSHIEKTASNTTKYNAFFAGVVLPTGATGVTGSTN